MKLLRQNITSNLEAVFPATKKGGRSKQKAQMSSVDSDRIITSVLDWEEDSVSHLRPVDIVIACDCIYNSHLIEPLNTTCASICKLNTDAAKPTLCLIAQQIRTPEIFESWLKSFHEKFEVWQIPDKLLVDELRENSGFVVHVGVVR